MSKRKPTTPAQDRAHLDRLAIINKPFPALGNRIPGKIWAGCLITHPEDQMLLKHFAQDAQRNRRVEEED